MALRIDERDCSLRGEQPGGGAAATPSRAHRVGDGLISPCGIEASRLAQSGKPLLVRIDPAAARLQDEG